MDGRERHVVGHYRLGEPFQRERADFIERYGLLDRDGCSLSDKVWIDYRFAANNPALFKAHTAELISLAPDAILTNSAAAIAALRQQTRTIPIVFVGVADPVGLGFVQSLARPGGNITGFTSFDAPLMRKWLQLLKEIAPNLTRVAVIFNPNSQLAASLANPAIEAAAPSFGISVTFAPVHDDAGIEEAVAALARRKGALEPEASPSSHQSPHEPSVGTGSPAT